MYKIYRILNVKTGFSYIGCSKHVENRWKEHKRHLNKGNHHNAHLQRAWNKYGETEFNWEILHSFETENAMFLEESKIIQESLNLYNIADGGIGGDKTKYWSKERKEEFRELKRVQGLQRFQKLGENEKCNPFKNLSEEERLHRCKIWSSAKKGKKNGKYKYDKPVLQIDIETGEVVKEWKDICEIGDSGLYLRRYVISCCLNKKGYRSHKGFLWKWKEN